MFRRAVENEPKNPAFQYHLGFAYARQGDTLKAKSQLETALRLNPEFKDAAEAKRLLANIRS